MTEVFEGPGTTVGALVTELGAGVAGMTTTPDAVVVTSVAHDSRDVVAGSLFCCVVGANFDGHRFAGEAVEAGAAALLVKRPVDLGGSATEVPQLVVPDVRAAMAAAAALVYGHPADRLRTVGVTGTNGKTTVVSMIAHILRSAGRDVETIGTLSSARTTPEATELQALMAGMVQRGVTDLAMEVSSHALVMHRVDSIRFDVAVFTNLGRDHLDFHRTPEAYFAAKALLFEPERSGIGVVDTDDVHGRLLLDAAEPDHPMVAVRLADAGAISTTDTGSVFTWRGRHVSIPMPGEYNIADALLAAEACVALGVDVDVVAVALQDMPVVPGRFEVLHSGQPFTVVVDYAHTPDALEHVLTAARGTTDGRLTVVFGCGGERDVGKRPLMGEVACRLADSVVLTDDNPRSEDPARIISQIRSGCTGDPLVIPDRRGAIRAALSAALDGDVVVIAGKGHEQGQDVAGTVMPFDDREVAREVLAELGFPVPGSDVAEEVAR